ncbi:MAG: PEP-CTERM sorting domain-containing protein [Planctomycetota bacterium]|nr:PEP-CTERM sorting domain-containing protein [Planctomycetota bacterium]
MFRTLSVSSVWCAVGFLVGVAAPAQGALFSFGPQDGYDVQSGLVYGDVSYYNAGQFGANAGGGPGPTQITADSGLWSVVGPAGGYFDNPVDRASYTLGTPPYSVSDPNAVASYLVGGHSGGRTDNWNLAMRNDRPLGTGAAVYEYQFDSYDFGGISPASVTSGPVQVGFYFCPNPGDSSGTGAAPTDKFTMSFKDSVGNIGFEWGYARDNSVTWRTSPSNSWNTTSFIADQTNWDGLRVDIDLTADTFSMDYYDVSANTWTNIVPSGTGMGQALNDLTVLRWQLEDGLFSGVGGKNFFDDFSVTPVPEPSTIVMFLMGAVALGTVAVRRRKR